MDVKKFSLYTVLGSLPWCFVLAYVGVVLGPHWEEVVGQLRYLNIAVVLGAAALIGYLIYRRAWVIERFGDRGKQ